jgi:predicted ArsR family transcriptional regulator
MCAMRPESRRNPRARQPVLGTTKGKILVTLCWKRQTVSELAEGLGLTDNAVRAQLERLERDGLVAKAGSRRGVRKPHVEYELTAEALTRFPKAYGTVLVHVVSVLRDRLRAGGSRGILLEAARRLLDQHLGRLRGRSPRQRLAAAIDKLNGAGLGIDVSERSGKTVIRSCSCPIASVTAVHPEVCALFATVLGEVLGADVSESCVKGGSPRCYFELVGSGR